MPNDYQRLADKLQRALDQGATEITADLSAPGEGGTRLNLTPKDAAESIVWLRAEVKGGGARCWFDVYGQSARAVVLRHLSVPDLASLAARLMHGAVQWCPAECTDDLRDVAGELERRSDDA